MIYYSVFKAKRSKYYDYYVEVDANSIKEAEIAFIKKYPNERFDITESLDISEYKGNLPRINSEEGNSLTMLPHDIPEN